MRWSVKTSCNRLALTVTVPTRCRFVLQPPQERYDTHLDGRLATEHPLHRHDWLSVVDGSDLVSCVHLDVGPTDTPICRVLAVLDSER